MNYSFNKKYLPGKIVIFLLFFSFFPSLVIATSSLQIDHSFSRIYVGTYLEFIEDKDKTLHTVDMIQKNDQWKSIEKKSIDLGFSSSAYWFRFSMNNTEHQAIPFYLEIDYPMIDRIDFYTPDESGNFIEKSMGDRFPFQEREISDRNFIFYLSKKPGQHTFYFRIETSSSINFTPVIWSHKAYIARSNSELPVFWIYYGCMIVMVAYNLFLFISIRERSYIYYVFFITAWILLQLTINGFSFQYLWPNAVWWGNNCLPFFMMICVLGCSIFFRSYIDTPNKYKTIDKIIVYSIITPSIIFGVLVFSGNYVFNIKAATALTTYAAPLLCGLAIVLSMKGSREARFFAIGFICFSIGGFLFSLKTFGVLPTNFLTRWSLQAGSVIAVVLLSLGLADKINLLKNNLVNINKNFEETDKALRESEKKYRMITEKVMDNIWLLDMKTQRVTYSSPSSKRILGYDPDEMIGLRMEELLPPESLDITKEIIWNEQNKEIREEPDASESHNIELQCYRKDKSTIWVEVSAGFLRDSENKPEYILGVTRDIDDRKKTEEKLLKAQTAAEAANSAKSDFLSNVSHEIRTPMNAIIGMSELILRADIKGKYGKHGEYVRIIHSSAKTLLKLINDMLDFSKIEAGKLVLENIPVSIREIVEEVANMIQEKLHEKEVELIVDIGSDIPNLVAADPLRLRQIIVNLANNAYKFTSKGDILISVQVQSISTEFVELLFCIRDSGIGLVEDQTIQNNHKNIFDAFTQGDGSTTRKYGGTGLGLAICKKIINMMNGDIWVESDPGKGSSFYFTTKFTRVAEKTNGKPAFQQFSILNDLSVLIVEDNPSTQQVLKRFLELLGLKPEVANTAESAIELYEKSIKGIPFDLILMDVRLPDMDGITASRKIKQNDRVVPPPIILISAFSSEKEITQAQALGIEYFMMKPIKQSTLYDTLMDIFGNRKLPSGKENEKIMASETFSDTNVLLVEDNIINQMVATEILTSAGIVVSKADTGIKALELIKSKHFDAVLMDIQMPEMDGIESTRIIRNVLNMKELPIIALTAHAMEGDRELCLEAGMNDYISKPIHADGLFSVLCKYLPHKNGIITKTKQEIIVDIKDDTLLAMLDGIDVESGLKRLSGNKKLLKKVIIEFRANHLDSVEELKGFLENEEQEPALRLIHTIKGVSGNCSAYELQAAVKKLEKGVKENQQDIFDELLRDFEKAMNRVMETAAKLKERENEINNNTKKVNHDKMIELKPSDVAPFLVKLSRYLNDNNPEAEACLESVKNQLQSLGSYDEIGILEDKIDKLDYKSAYKILADFMEKLGIDS